jgi:hypothetical protein
MAETTWRKLHENFEKTSNARVVQLRKKLTSLTLMPRNSIAEYVGEFRGIRMDLETAGQTVFELELAVHALSGLPKEYATLVEYLELSKTELTLDMIQPKLMQREQKLKSLGAEVEVSEEQEKSFKMAFVAKRERYWVIVTKGLKERGNTGGVKGEASDMRTCCDCGEKGHVRAHCRKRSAECYNCGERGHISSVCRKPRCGAKVVVKTGRSLSVWHLRHGPKRRGRRRVCGSLTRKAPNTLRQRRANSQATRGLSTKDRGAWGRSLGGRGDWEGRETRNGVSTVTLNEI